MWVERNGKSWRIREEVGGKKITVGNTTYPTRTLAERAMTMLRADELRGDSLAPGGGRLTLDAFLDEWWPHYERSLKPSARHSEGGRMRNHVRDLLGTFPLGQIDSMLVAQWVDALSAGEPDESGGWVRRPLSPKTVHNCHGLLFVIMDAAVRAKLIRVNPCVGTKLPVREHREMRFLTDPEIVRLVAALAPHWRPLVVILVATGLRWGEAIGLKAGRVDLLAKRPILRVEEALQEMAGTGELIFVTPKSRHSRRTVSFTRQAADLLVPLVAAKKPDELVFLTPTGLPIRTRNFRRIWLTAVKAAGLDGLRVHDLRHTHVAMLIAANRPLSAISRRLGHSSIAITDSLYGHLREEVDDGILAAVDDALRGIDLADRSHDRHRGEIGGVDPERTRTDPTRSDVSAGQEW